jgi:beta-lysine 5,6-aminomutase beta subunit
MGYNLENKVKDTKKNTKNILPYGDTMNDGKVQLSFTLPVKNDEKGYQAAILTAQNMLLENVMIADAITLEDTFTMYVVYGTLTSGVNYEEIQVEEAISHTYSKEEIEALIEEHFDHPITVVGASTGTDAHTVGIDAIMNMKGFAGHYGLERYKGIETYNLGSQVENEDFIQFAKEKKADVLLISQTVTQKEVHIKNLIHFIELLEAENLRKDFIVIVGGARITGSLAKELGFDAGFGPKKFAEDVATFFVEELINRTKQSK